MEINGERSTDTAISSHLPLQHSPDRSPPPEPQTQTPGPQGWGPASSSVEQTNITG